jgi:UTP--glucose-1-phosphate uridylyltransferase
MTSRDALAAEISQLSPAVRERLAHHGFDEARLLDRAATLEPPPSSGAAPDAERARQRDRNRVRGDVTPARPGEILEMPAKGSAEESACLRLGEEALRRGEVAMCVLAGGMATRMGGVVKALVEALPGKTFLDLRLAENRAAGARYGKPIPLWLMTSDATDGPTEAALRERGSPSNVACFVQGLSLRLTPEGTLFRDDAGEPSTYAPGHGDLPDALRRSGLLARFRSQGGRVVVLANLDNLGATIDEVILGVFLRERERAGARVMVEVCDKVEGDKGGGPVHAEGALQVVEEFRLPEDFDTKSVRVFSTNTFVVDAQALDETPVAWSWFHVEKNAFGRKAVQFERLIQEITKAMPATYLRVPREGATSRFLPVKDFDELARRRSDIEAVARTRGALT